MRRTTLFLAALLLVAASGRTQSGLQAGITLGPTWAMAGDSPIFDPFEVSVANSFKDDFDTGWSFGAWAAGPLSEMFGWRAEFSRDSMPADADQVSGNVSGDYKLFRLQGGVQITPFKSDGGGPYGFFTVGLAKEDATLDIDTAGGNDVDIDFDGRSAFGMSFGGGYNWLIGDNWGLGADLHINSGAFEDETRWWWTPSAQAFFKW
jgi:hypothetical protein